ncbi:MAG: ATP-binding protein [Candidatus Desulfaltia sp.]|nr:ATP-binding protein [Candidatus Desulfaltia sp.]
MSSFVITPKVDETQEFIEIANDFSNPLDLVREAISNAYDAKATEIIIIFEVVQEYGESILKISIIDDGSGMNQEGLQSFFDLGNSLRRNDPEAIGEKGHGTKVYFNSKKIEVITNNSGVIHHAIMDEPFRKLYNREIPTVVVTASNADGTNSGTRIIIYGYNNNRREKFTHEILRDYILWSTKHGSVERQFEDQGQEVKLVFKGLGAKKEEILVNGHYFPENSDDINKLFETHITKAPDYFCKKIVKSGHLKNFPEINYQAIFAIEGKYVKYNYNNMLRRPGYSPPSGSYTIQERYGLWLCKDFIPIQRKNEWITFKGSEYTKFHAFFNCQNLKLTANRGSIENTPSEVLQDIHLEVRKIYDEIIKGDDWTAMEWLEDEAAAYQTTEKERSNFQWRIKKVNRSNVATYNGVTLVEPERESGVYSIFIHLSILNDKLFPFQVIDYDTHQGIDVIVKGDKNTPISSSKLFYIEFKRTLERGFNHSFENLHSLICWETEIKHYDILSDINGEERKMQIIAPSDGSDYTRYFLDNPKKAHKIEVYVLKQYLKEKLNIDFKPRTADAIV